jgi:myosin heavy subunit
VLDSLKVRKKNYPIRRPYQGFYQKFGDMTKNPCFPDLVASKADFRKLTEQMFKDTMPEIGPDLVLFGKSRIFIRLEAMPKIERRFAELMFFKNKMAIRVQKNWKTKQLLKNLHKFSLRLKWIRSRLNEFRTRIYFK